MIQANELRIGNWVYPNEENATPWKIQGVLNDEMIYFGLTYGNRREEICASQLDPIPLTPEILLACGFIKRTWGKPDPWDQYGDSYGLGHYDTNYVLHRSWEKEPDWCVGIECTDANEDINYISEHFCWNIKYLHELQNLWLILTKEELEYIPV